MADKGGSKVAPDAKNADALMPAAAAAPFDFSNMLMVADMLPVMVCTLDRDTRYRFVNKPYADWFEQPRSALLGKRLAEVLGEEAFEFRKPMIAAALAGETQFFVFDYDHPTRGKVAVQTSYVPWTGAGGEVHGIVCLLTDVTEQRVAERALKESEERFRRIANSAPALMWVTRLDRVRDFVNDAYAEFVCGPGCNTDDARALDWRTRIHPDDVDRIVAESIAGEASRERFTLEGRYRRWDGEYRWLRSVSQPRLGPDGELIGFIGVGGDVTLQKEAELELR
ncbi:MAG: hypothetical protein QOE50_1397, partial [Sphingomonadales bacterium]|nr:hypothetical protein [Sphingomonadales bacterium]